MIEYTTAVHDFAAGRFYQGDVGALPGAASMVAAALFMMEINEVAGTRTIFGNADGALAGWELQCDPSTGVVRAVVGATSIAAQFTTAFISKPILAHLRLNAGTLELYINGCLAISSAGAVMAPALATRPAIGVRNPAAPAQAATQVALLGAAYIEDALTPGQLGSNFLASREANDIAQLTDLAVAPDYTNRYSAKLGNNGAGAPPTVIGITTWLDQVGNVDLTRVGSPTIRGFKNLDWSAGIGEGADFLANTFAQNFVFADLVAGVLMVTHNLNSGTVAVVVRDNTNALIVPDAVTMPTANTATIDLTTFGAFAGTWRVLVIGQ